MSYEISIVHKRYPMGNLEFWVQELKHERVDNFLDYVARASRVNCKKRRLVGFDDFVELLF